MRREKVNFERVKAENGIKIIEPQRAGKGWASSGRVWFIEVNGSQYAIVGYAGKFNLYRYTEEVAKSKARFSTFENCEQYLIKTCKLLKAAIEAAREIK